MITRRRFIVKGLLALSAVACLPFKLLKAEPTADVWHHVGTVFSAADSRIVSLDGRIRVEAIWDTALSAEELKLLPSGILPSMIRPKHLVYWCPRKSRSGLVS